MIKYMNRIRILIISDKKKIDENVDDLACYHQNLLSLYLGAFVVYSIFYDWSKIETAFVDMSMGNNEVKWDGQLIAIGDIDRVSSLTHQILSNGKMDRKHQEYVMN